uniref:Uncharacterized protein n=1 Tax=Brassica oleracea var. oleracea TaxID=109376 RepID=A0A0D3B4Z0_BRAOL
MSKGENIVRFIIFLVIFLVVSTEKIAAEKLDRDCRGLPLLVAPPKICDKQIECDRHCKAPPLNFVRGACVIPKRASTKVCTCYRNQADCKAPPR